MSEEESAHKERLLTLIAEWEEENGEITEAEAADARVELGIERR